MFIPWSLECLNTIIGIQMPLALIKGSPTMDKWNIFVEYFDWIE